MLDRIRADTEKEVKAILGEAEAKASQAETTANARREELHHREFEALRSRLVSAETRKQSAREIELRHKVLIDREGLLSEARRRLEKWLSSLPPEQASRLLAGFMAQARALVPKGTVTSSARTKKLLGRSLEGFDFTADENIEAGFRVRSSDERRVVDLTFESVIADFWERERADVAGDLFGDAMSGGGKMK
jgi:vacuolar-type H+-ATPase subunit E/Vma4